jgi:predicted RNA-binding protein associated with RNAse of E/G family
MVEITVYKYDYQGEEVYAYKAHLLDFGPDWVSVYATFEREDVDLGVVVLRQGDRFTEWFYADRWYNVFRVEDGVSGELKGWYCNITRPAVITAESVGADDLQLDIFVTPTGNLFLLDEDEFSALDIPVDERMAAVQAVELVRQAVAARITPFSEIRPE